MESSISQRASSFVIKKRLAGHQLKLEEGRAYFCRFDEKYEQSKPLKNGPKSGAADYKEPPYIANVTHYIDGDSQQPEQRQIILPTVLRDLLDEHGPKASYVGRTYRIVRHRGAGKRYNTFELDEVTAIN